MSDNPQFIRTDRAIIHAFITLLKYKPFEKITVQDILEQTPVSRATFYSHYRDKYEIAEKMMSNFISVRGNFRKSLSSPSSAADALSKNPLIERDYLGALLQIHTEKVDFRRDMAIELEKEYLASTDSPTREIEARIYSRAYVELYIAFVNEEIPAGYSGYPYQILIPVALKLLQLPDGKEEQLYLKRIISEINKF